MLQSWLNSFPKIRRRGFGPTEGHVFDELKGLQTRLGLREDIGQVHVAKLLDGLLDVTKRTGPLSQVMRKQGVYVHGSVGTGKTVVMDCFHRVVKSKLSEFTTRRVHFHQFMLDIHKDLHQTKSMDKTVERVAQTKFLCFDEFQVTDVADAVILHRLFKGLFERGTVVVATSNREPSLLYENGINREALFRPFQNLLEETCHVVNINEVGTGTDYRRVKSAIRQPTVLHPASSPSTVKRMDELFHTLSGRDGRCGKVNIPVGMGRTLEIELSKENGVAKASFEELCAKPLGSADYLALSEHCRTLLIDHVPILDASLHNEARRFITLIDVFYDRHRNLVISAEKPLEKLFEDVGGVVLVPDDLRVDHDTMMDKPEKMPFITPAAQAQLQVIDKGGSSGRATTMLSDHVEWSATGRMHVSLAELAAVQDVSFAFSRALSRLIEMQTEKYWSANNLENKVVT